MKKKSIVFSICCLSIIFHWNNTLAAVRDTLKGSEGLPVFSIIYKSDNTSIPCYIEYHEYMKEYFNKGVESYFRTCIDYKFHNKNISHIYTSSIDSFRIGHDFYKRILKNTSIKGILVKQILSSNVNCYEYLIDDYTDLNIKDSLKSLSFGLGAKNNQQSYLIFEVANQFYFYSTTNDKIDLPITTNYTLLTSVEIVPFLKKQMGDKLILKKNMETLYSISDIKSLLIQINNENKR